MKIAGLTKLLITGLFVSQAALSNVLQDEYRLISTNGTSWNEVTSIPSSLTFDFPVTTYSQSGNTNWTWLAGSSVSLFHGDCVNRVCQSSNQLFNGAIGAGVNTMISGLPVTTVYGPNGFLSLSELSQACASQAGGVYASHTVQRDLVFTTHAKGNRSTSGPSLSGESIEEYTDTKAWVQVSATIHCESFGADPGPITAQELKVFLATNSGATTNPSAAVECPMTRATVRIKANRVGVLPVKVQTRVGTNPTVSQQKDIQVTLQSDGSFTGWYEEWISVSQTSVVSLKAVELDNPYVFNDVNLETQWKDISLVCSGHGGAGLTVNTGQSGEGGSSTPQVNPNVNGSGTLIMTPDHTGGGAPTGIQVAPSQLPKTPTTRLPNPNPTSKTQTDKTQKSSKPRR